MRTAHLLKFASVVLALGALVVVLGLVVPGQAQAQSGIVQCESALPGSTGTTGLPACDLCQLIGTANNIINILFGFLTGVGVLLIIVSGMIYVISSGSESLVGKAKTTLKFTIIGIIVALLAYALVKVVVVVAFGAEVNPFGSIECDVELTSLTSASGTQSTGGQSTGQPSTGQPSTGQPSTGTRRCPECEESPELSQFVSCMRTETSELARERGESFTLGQVSTTSGAHDTQSCHFGGTCADGGHAVDFGGGGGATPFTAGQAQIFADATSTCTTQIGIPSSKIRYENASSCPLSPGAGGVTHVHIEIGDRESGGGCGCPGDKQC
jgi:hypothetical protein